MSESNVLRYENDKGDEIAAEMNEAAELGDDGSQILIHKLKNHTDSSPMLSGGDVDAAWDEAAVGEESVGGENPTPDQSVVSELGEAMGITYNDNEPLHTEEKLLERDRHRWELDPASAEDFGKKIS
ncbi:MAG: hypothetical protein KA746_14770 [Pyrinomonadaceae bacterium]|nr:hypothetical protein [Pyrinomonadaceae bacterium]